MSTFFNTFTLKAMRFFWLNYISDFYSSFQIYFHNIKISFLFLNNKDIISEFPLYYAFISILRKYDTVLMQCVDIITHLFALLTIE